MASGITTSSQLGGPEFELRWGRDFSNLFEPAPRSSQTPTTTGGKLTVAIRNTLRLSSETSPQSLNKNHTEENSSRKTPLSYLIRKYHTTVNPVKHPVKFAICFLILFNVYCIKTLSHFNFKPKIFYMVLHNYFIWYYITILYGIT